MIESIVIADVATYAPTPETLAGLSNFNFVFGSNGTGKTTISRVIADENGFPTCKVTWKAGTKLQPMVYNRDFVERNFTQSTELKGVFTLGETQVDTLTKIAASKVELNRLTKKIEDLTQALQGTDGTGGKKGELAKLEADLKDKCWAQKQKYDAKLQGGFEGYRGNSEKFKAKVIQPERSNLAIQNTLRRILENYFKILGGIELDELCAMFEGRERIICKSLCSWVHDGSHYSHDDLYVSIDDSMVEIYLKVFREIFIKARQIDHYKMMMGDAFVEVPTAFMASAAGPLPASQP